MDTAISSVTISRTSPVPSSALPANRLRRLCSVYSSFVVLPLTSMSHRRLAISAITMGIKMAFRTGSANKRAL